MSQDWLKLSVPVFGNGLWHNGVSRLGAGGRDRPFEG